MKEAEIIDFENNIEDTSGPRGRKPRTLNPDSVSPEEVAKAFLAPHIDSLSPEEILILQEEGRLPKGNLNSASDDEAIDTLEPKPVSVHLTSPVGSNERDVEEMLRVVNEKNEPSPVIRERAALVSKKNDDFLRTRQSHGLRGREPKGKFKKGLKTTKYN